MMRRALAVLAVALVAAIARAEAPLDPLWPAMERAIARVKPALVRIQVVWTDYSQGREIKREASGSGFIIHKKGYIVTNHHVAGRATRAVCVFSNNEEIEATLVGTDPLTDIAVLKLDDSKHAEFPTVDWGDSSALAVGDTVLAMGSPLALSQSVTRGILSNTKMTMPSFGRRDGSFSLEGEDVGALVRWLAHDAPIYPGNSGGPLVNLQGQVVGINEISLGLGGAIPANLAREVADQLIAQGRVRRSWLGIELQPLLKVSGLTNGVLISNVIADSPAERAGLRAGDVLVRLAGKDTTVRFGEEMPLLNALITGLPVDHDVVAVVQRDASQTNLTVRTAEREPVELLQQELKPWGLTVKNISAMIAREMQLDSRDGVLVTSVRPGGPAGEAKPMLDSGDVIRAVAGQPVNRVADLMALTARITDGQNKPVPTAVEFLRRSERFLTVVKVGIREVEDPGLEARKAWLPVAVQAITREMVERLGTNDLTGVRITQVYTNTTAEAAGLRVGDWILAIDGESIPASQPGDEEVFTSRIRQFRIGAKPEFTLLRDGQPMKIAAELVRSPKLEREMKKFQDLNFEFSGRDLSFFDRVREQLPDDTAGALVTEVKDGGWAALGGLQANDIVQSVDGEIVADAAALETKMKAIAQQKPKFVVLGVRRGIHARWLELEPNWETTK
jgi:serine protease Do